MHVLRDSSRLTNEVPNASRASKAPAVVAARGQNFLEAYSPVRSTSTDVVPLSTRMVAPFVAPQSSAFGWGALPFSGHRKTPRLT
jgi:hypothetical protein